MVDRDLKSHKSFWKHQFSEIDPEIEVLFKLHTYEDVVEVS